MSFRPRFSTARTKVPSLGKRIPVFCDRIGLLVFNRSPGLMFISVLWLIMRCETGLLSDPILLAGGLTFKSRRDFTVMSLNVFASEFIHFLLYLFTGSFFRPSLYSVKSR
jgi:hypothetical protein